MEQEKILQTFFDQMITDENGQMLKAMIPYLPPGGQQIFSLYAKAREFYNTAVLFGKNTGDMQICSMPESDSVEILENIKQYSYGKSRQRLDQITNMIAMIRIMQLMKD
ncbi:hypothetical protein [Blautia sp. HCP28S3_G10]|uniref:hypothetical protein n=1 Tax=Blautia sp. HCP28S3_G10 TaxID=3438908 RepID=UPI003F89B381